MALTRLQARPRYIVGSMAMFLDRNLKQAYDSEAAASAGQSPDYSKPMRIMRGKPDDQTIVRAAPSIAISTLNASQHDGFYEIGTNVRYRASNFVFYCFPAIDANGQPCDVAAELLKAYMIDAFGTYGIKVLDYSNPSFSSTNILYTPDLMEIVSVGDPIDRNVHSALAEEKHRFDFHVSVKYPVQENSAT